MVRISLISFVLTSLICLPVLGSTFPDGIVITPSRVIVKKTIDLNGNVFLVPEGKTLVFKKGGLIINGSVQGNGNKLKSAKHTMFGHGSTLDGKWEPLTLFPEQFGAFPNDGLPDNDGLSRLFSSCPNNSEIVFQERGVYNFTFDTTSVVQIKPTHNVLFKKSNITINGNGCCIEMTGLQYNQVNSLIDPGAGSGRDIFTFCSLIMCDDICVFNFNCIGDFKPFSSHLKFSSTTAAPRAKFIGCIGSHNVTIHNIYVKNIIGNAINATPSMNNDYQGASWREYRNININKCCCDGAFENGINLMGGGADCSIRECRIRNAYNGIEVGSKNTIISNNTIDSSYGGISVRSLNIQVIENSILNMVNTSGNTGVGLAAIYVSGSKEIYSEGLNIINNHIENIPRCALYVSPGNNNINVSNNIILDVCYEPSDGYAYALFFNGTSKMPIMNASISNNKLTLRETVQSVDKKNNRLCPFLLRNCKTLHFQDNLTTYIETDSYHPERVIIENCIY